MLALTIPTVAPRRNWFDQFLSGSRHMPRFRMLSASWTHRRLIMISAPTACSATLRAMAPRALTTRIPRGTRQPATISGVNRYLTDPAEWTTIFSLSARSSAVPLIGRTPQPVTSPSKPAIPSSTSAAVNARSVLFSTTSNPASNRR